MVRTHHRPAHVAAWAGTTILAFALLALPGCMKVGPDYKPPKTEVPASWELPQDPAVLPGESQVRSWWQVFGDPQLTSLVERSAKANLNLKSAIAKVKEARYQIGVVSGDELPSLDGSGKAEKYGYSENDSSVGGANFDRGVVGLSANWEFDVFGRIARNIEAAEADYQASQEDRVDVMITLFAEVARSYLTVRTNQARLMATTQNIDSQLEVLKLTRVRFENGLATGLDVAQAESVLASSQAGIPPLKYGITQAINTLAGFLAQPPGVLDPELRNKQKIPLPPRSVTVGLPVDLLRRRPDIRKAERQLAAATARIGAATGELYPKFSLAGTLGFSANAGGNLFKGDSLNYSIIPGVTWSLFQGGSLRSQIKVQDALTEQALYTYEQTVISALNETSSSMSAYVQERARLQALRRTVAAQRLTLDMAVSLYKEGLKDFQSVLDAQRELFQYDNELAQSRGDAASNLVSLYKALGGGWDPQKPPLAPVPIELRHQNPPAGQVVPVAAKASE